MKESEKKFEENEMKLISGELIVEVILQGLKTFENRSKKYFYFSQDVLSQFKKVLEELPTSSRLITRFVSLQPSQKNYRILES